MEETRIQVLVAAERLRAEIAVRPGPAAGAAELRTALKKAGLGIAWDQKVFTRLSRALADAEYSCPKECIAQGQAPVPGVPPRIELIENPTLHSVGQSRHDGSIDYRERRGLVNYKNGDRIARFHPAQPGIPGMGVDGKPIPAPLPAARLPKLGPGVTQAEDGHYYAARDGMLHHVADTLLDVRETSRHEGDVDLQSGNLHGEGSLVIEGDVQNGALVEASSHILIHGSIVDGCARAGADLEVRGGIQGRGAGATVAQGSIRCAHLGAAQIEAQGTVTVADHCLNSRVRCAAFRAIHGRGKVAGGSLRVSRRIHIKEAGSAHGTPTQLIAGWPHQELVAVQRARAEHERFRRQRNKRSDRLRSGARGKGGKTGRAMSQASRRLRRAQQLLQEALRTLLAEAEIQIETRVHPGVELCIGNRRLQIHDPQGPLRFTFQDDRE